ncbi:MAG: nitrate- and nitrite sensing domain-containing protein, partial [Pseudomonadota bacterium]
MTIRKQMLLLVAFPALGLLLVGGFLCIVKFMEYREMAKGQQQVAQAQALSELVHVLQVERGQSAGFVASGGVNFSDELPQSRAAVDASLGRLTGSDGAMQTLAGSLSQWRAAVDAQAESLPEIVSAYTGFVQNALEMSEELVLSQTDPELTRLGAGLVGLSEAKEAAGLQRAAGASGLGAGTFNAATFRAFLERGAVEASHLK